MRTLRCKTLGTSTALAVDLVLEPQTAHHALALFPVLCDPAILRHDSQPPESVACLLQRFADLESRRSPDGRQQWLNWVVRTDCAMPDWTGAVQATLDTTGDALIGYEFGSEWWGRGVAFAAVGAMLDEVAARYGATRAVAVAHHANSRSHNLLRRLRFEPTDCWPAMAAEGSAGAEAAEAADEGCWLRRLDLSVPPLGS